MSGQPDVDVAVVGAGLAGLSCATALVGAGLEVGVWESADAVGGRVRSEDVDGFVVDVGFQLLNPGYPAVRRWVDTTALELQPFPAGVAARTARGTEVLADPRRAPRLAPASARAVLRRPAAALALARWGRPLATRDTSRLVAHLAQVRPDLPVRDSLSSAGVRGDLRLVLERFLAGVVLDDSGDTSDAFALLLSRSFLSGTPALPRRGMRALPEQLAAGLGARLHLGCPVDSVAGSGHDRVLHTADGPVRARTIVMAGSAPATERLLGVASPAVRGVVTHWWSAPASSLPPESTRAGLLHVDARQRPTGPLVNTAVVSAAAPSYAPAGRHLIQGSALIGAARSTPGAAEMARHAADLLGTSERNWESVARHEIFDALPAQLAPLQSRRSVQVEAGLFVCGDHRDTASIQGALVSGHRAAGAVVAHLA